MQVEYRAPMKVRFENQGSKTNLVYEIQESDRIDTMSMGMITNNRINGLAKAIFTQMDTSKYLKYDISAKVSAKELFSNTVSKRQLLTAFSNIVDTIVVMEEYMIDESLLLFDLEYIFIDLSTYETLLICIPITNIERNYTDLKSFVKYIIFNATFNSNESTEYVTKIINYLNSNKAFSVTEFKRILDELKQSKGMISSNIKKDLSEKLPVKENPGRKELVKETPLHEKKTQYEDVEVDDNKGESDEEPISLWYLLQHYNKENAALYKSQKERKKNAAQKDRTREDDLDILFGSKKNSGEKKNDINFAIPGQERYIEKSSKSYPDFKVEKEIVSGSSIEIPRGEDMDFGDTVYEEEDVTEGTELLEEEELNNDYPYLIAKASGEKIIISKPFFKIGRKQDYADFCIKKSTISDKHAYIVKREEGFYIVDTKSKNHTYLNDMKIQDNVEIKLEHCTEIRFAKEMYEFRMY